MNATTYVRTIRRRWMTVAVCVLISLPIGWVLGQAAPPADASNDEELYTATTYLEPASSSSTLYPGEGGTEGGLEDIAFRVTRGEVPSRVMEALNYQQSPDEFEEQTEVTAEEVGSLLTVTATNRLPRRAEDIADAFALEIILAQNRLVEEELAEIEEQIIAARDERRSLRQQANQDGTEEQLRAEIRTQEVLIESLEEQQGALLSGATAQLKVYGLPAVAVPVTESTGLSVPASRVVRMLIVVLLGLAVGIALALVRERLDPRVQDRDQAEDAFALPVLAEIPKMSRRYRSSVIVTVAPGAPASNAYQLLAAGLLFGRHRADAPSVAIEESPPAKTILVTSALGSEGRASAVANLAAAFAGIGKRVIVISSAFGDHSVAHLLRATPEPGLADVLDELNEVEPEEALHDTSLAQVRMIPAGRDRRPTGGRSLLSSDRLDGVLKDAAANADIVVIDAAPVLAKSDWSLLIPKIDGVLIVAKAGVTPWAAAERTAELLKMLQAPCFGVVLDQLPLSAVRRGGYRRDSLGRGPEPEAMALQGPTTAHGAAESPVVTIETTGNGAKVKGDGALHPHVHPHMDDG